MPRISARLRSESRPKPRSVSNSNAINITASTLDAQSTESSLFPALPWHDSFVHRLGLSQPRTTIITTATTTTNADEAILVSSPPIPRVVQTETSTFVSEATQDAAEESAAAAAHTTPIQNRNGTRMAKQTKEPVVKRKPEQSRMQAPLPRMITTVGTVKRKPGRPRKHPLPDDIKTPPAKRGPGRPRKHPPPKESATSSVAAASAMNVGATSESQVAKRGPGRPRKHPLPKESATSSVVATASVTKVGATSESQVAKRGPGRPRKHPLPKESATSSVVATASVTKVGATSEIQAAKRRSGRPRKHPLPKESATSSVVATASATQVGAASERAGEKRGPGRPRKHPLPKESATLSIVATSSENTAGVSSESPVARRGPGKSRKQPLLKESATSSVVAATLAPKVGATSESPGAKHESGRPRKNPIPEKPAAKRGGGRPRKHPLPEESWAASVVAASADTNACKSSERSVAKQPPGDVVKSRKSSVESKESASTVASTSVGSKSVVKRKGGKLKKIPRPKKASKAAAIDAGTSRPICRTVPVMVWEDHSNQETNQSAVSNASSSSSSSRPRIHDTVTAAIDVNRSPTNFLKSTFDACAAAPASAVRAVEAANGSPITRVTQVASILSRQKKVQGRSDARSTADEMDAGTAQSNEAKGDAPDEGNAGGNAPELPKKKRGRPRKHTVSDTSSSPSSLSTEGTRKRKVAPAALPGQSEEPQKRKRGRPPKKPVEGKNAVAAAAAAKPDDRPTELKGARKRKEAPSVRPGQPESSPERKRGRPPMKRVEDETTAAAAAKPDSRSSNSDAPTKKPGRQRNVSPNEATFRATKPPKRGLGRPRTNPASKRSFPLEEAPAAGDVGAAAVVPVIPSENNGRPWSISTVVPANTGGSATETEQGTMTVRRDLTVNLTDQVEEIARSAPSTSNKIVLTLTLVLGDNMQTTLRL